MIRTILRIFAASVAVLGLGTLLAITAAPLAHAEHEDRALHVTRIDGSPVGTLFSDWVMVPGDKVSTTVVAHRTGPGESSLLITLGNESTGHLTPTAVEDDVLISIRTNGIELTSTASALKTGATIFDLGRSAAPSVPIEVTFELPFSSGNDTQQQSLDLSLVVTAADIPVSTPGPTPGKTPQTQTQTQPTNNDTLASVLPFLPNTGTAARELLILAAVVTTIGLLFLGGKRKSCESRKAH